MLSVKKLDIPGLELIDLSVEAGGCVGISGDSGCGKSRLLRAIADMDENSGEVCVDEVCAKDMPAHEWRLKVGLLPAESQWWFDSVGAHFADDGIDFSSLGFDKDVISWDVSRCSSGEKQRLSILRLLANRPRVLLLDEPTANLDNDNTHKVEALIADYLEQNQAVAIWVSHNRAQLQRISPRLSFDLSNGCLQAMEQ